MSGKLPTQDEIIQLCYTIMFQEPVIWSHSCDNIVIRPTCAAAYVGGTPPQDENTEKID